MIFFSILSVSVTYTLPMALGAKLEMYYLDTVTLLTGPVFSIVLTAAVLSELNKVERSVVLPANEIGELTRTAFFVSWHFATQPTRQTTLLGATRTAAKAATTSAARKQLLPQMTPRMTSLHFVLRSNSST